MKAALWWRALNPAIYLISLLPAVVVYMLAADPVWLSGLLFATLAVVLLQHGINLFNDVSDWQLGADTHKMDSWVRIYAGDTDIIRNQAIVSFLLGGLVGLAVLFVSHQLWILFFAIPMVLLGYLYNAGKRPLSYTAMGEWVTGLCYGPGVFGGLWLVAGQALGFTALLGMLIFAALAMALLLSHQPPQIDTDKLANKHSFAVRYGAATTWQVSRLLFSLSLLLIGVGFFAGGESLYFLMVYAVAVIIALLYLHKLMPNPQRILMPALCIIVGSAMLQFIMQP